MIQCHPKIAISVLVGKLKGKSSYFLSKEFWNDIKDKLWGDHFWSPSYCLVSYGGTPLEIVKEYVENQRKPTLDKHLAQSERFRGRKRNSDKTWKKSRQCASYPPMNERDCGALMFNIAGAKASPVSETLEKEAGFY